ncbi:MAG: hypothetical protein TE42_00580 [Candidatus Synechococcus spongiarum SP3]|uniref:Uncharacterized protein n=1 Tax=Candidatus Synechococcus spongiarum SP3 TaxID=1604020 RepID=A0A0G2HMR6_9SYNE|nr:MAG: hypothetical protein TE42_00580 [Candidatus Synechococcus spongiarum SP3]
MTPQVWHWPACALVLGVVQSLIEFPPSAARQISSLKAAPVLPGWCDPGVAVTVPVLVAGLTIRLFFYEGL